MNFHIYHHVGAEDLRLLTQNTKKMADITIRLGKIEESINIMSKKLQEQETQLQEGIGGVREGLNNLQSRVNTIIKDLETKNDESDDTDLSDEIAALEELSTGINGMFPAAVAETEEEEGIETTVAADKAAA